MNEIKKMDRFEFLSLISFLGGAIAVLLSILSMNKNIEFADLIFLQIASIFSVYGFSCYIIFQQNIIHSAYKKKQKLQEIIINASIVEILKNLGIKKGDEKYDDR